MDLRTIKRQLCKLDLITDIEKYRTSVHIWLKKNSFKEFGSGSYCTVYSAKSTRQVIKISDSDSTPFKKRYGKGYLKPTFVSKNKLLVVQPKALTIEDIMNKLEKYSEDVHEGNIGWYRGKPCLIDLDNGI